MQYRIVEEEKVGDEWKGRREAAEDKYSKRSGKKRIDALSE